MNTGKAITGILAGIASGLVLGVLFAPQKGRDIRKKMIRKGEDFADAIDNRIDQKFEEYERRVDELIKELTGKIAFIKNDKNAERTPKS
ncbi:YtxH domain-containing protein [Negadavirga shengliensis]|uniref:YtxH domain-containing protein n=1 Tax=Negadavirga shengliensis TaxID=1389218 RepID=A0ABV9SWP9_9BACT